MVIQITASQLIIIRAHASAADVGGRSNIGSRDGVQVEWQLTGMTGEAAAWIAFEHRGFLGWDRQRCQKNRDPTKGDSGADLLGDVDVKSSLRRSPIPTARYHLWVRPREFSPGKRYILALVDKTFASVDLVGWCPGKDLALDSSGRYSISAADLQPFRH